MAVPDHLAALGLREQPFGLSPEARFLVERGDHREGLARILFGLSQLGGIVLITGEIGAGKTVLAGAVRRALDGEGFQVLAVANPPRTPAALLSALLAGPDGDAPGGGTARLAGRLRQRIAFAEALGRRTIIVIDEAQRLNGAALDELRLMTNPDEGPGAGVVLLCQPELSRLVERHPQVAQRVVVRYHMHAMTEEEVATYVDRRSRVAGAAQPLFSRRAARAIHRETGGLPRLVNLVSANALFVAATRGLDRVDEDVVMDVVEDRRESEREAGAAP